MKNIQVWTDGSCLGNPGPGGWAYVMLCDGVYREDAGGCHHSTNNRMELQAVIEALEFFKNTAVFDVYTDSQYVQQGMLSWIHNWQRNNWRTSKGKDVLNKDLWMALCAQATLHTVTWHWVKGHHVDVHNQKADALARRAAELYRVEHNGQ